MKECGHLGTNSMKMFEFRHMQSPQDSKWFFASVLLFMMVLFPLNGLTQFKGPSRGATKAYEKAIEAYRLRAPNVALVELNRAIAKSPDYAEAWFLKAQILQENQHPEAEAVLSQALSLDATRHPRSWVDLAQIQWEMGKYAEGMASLQQLASLSHGGLSEEAEDQREWVEAGLRFSLEVTADTSELQKAFPLEGEINTDADEYYGALDLSGTRLVFTRARSEQGRVVPGLGAGGDEDFYEAFLGEDGTWSAARALNGVNTPLPEGAPTLSGDGKTMIFTACETAFDGFGVRRGKGSCDLFESNWDDKTQTWSKGKNLGAPNSKGWESQPALSADGNTLIFTQSNFGRSRPSDLVICHRLDHGGWSSPRSLSGTINTDRYEESAYLHPDGKSLYFSSDGHPGLGRLDVFVSRLQKDGTWGEPQNLGPAVNSHARDNSLMVLPRGGKAIFATSRGGTSLDFWEVELPSMSRPTEVASLKGKVMDARSGEALEAEVVLLDEETGQAVASTMSRKDEGFVIPLPGLGTYSFQASAKDHLFGMQTFVQTGGSALNRTPFVQIDLEPIHVGATLELQSIHFESGLSRLSSSYQAGCERLMEWMKANPGVAIRIIGHTDNVGSLPFNMALSEDRAAAVRDFLVAKGVTASRIEIEGKGPLEPMADNNTEAGQAQNRRVVVEILD